MSALARARLESLLRARKLDVTLTSALPPEVTDPLPTGIDLLDARLGGGLPRGQLSEVVGPRSSGRTSLIQAVAAATTGRGEIAALVDAFDSFDPWSAAAAGVELSRLLWIRGHHPSDARSALMGRVVERVVKALGIVLHAGGCGLVVVDFADVPARAIRQLPFTTWLRVGRIIEGSRMACVLVASDPIARSAGGVTLALRAAPSGGRWSGLAEHVRVFRGFDVCVRIASARLRPETEEAVRLRIE